MVGLALVGSQAGHLLAYQMRFGAAAQQVQSTGAHSYFPLLVKTTLGAIAAAVLAGLLLVGLARVLGGRRVRPVSRPSFVGLLAVLFTIQLAVFAGQEVVEALIAGSPVGSAPDLLLWGALGQLPVAVIATLALRWLGAHVESAVGSIRDAVAALRAAPLPALTARAAYATPDRALLMSRVAGTSLAKRGPPSSLHISTH
ncbi:MAG: hypothetical protein AUG06_09925 [Actinobacteria bacterium 13_1_20CM_2_65_11]|nr:MAG: hypothetical protein AUH69_02245 [Actinobacteria bacterium 13_1_40CM_4_65_12]OLD24755.1 MAG: hypothetical protein AUJ02_07055 [Chloroflexi bacterium 13_1_40CM_3_65_12]OLD50636.1 MAG: hypothetical protein AUI42_02310 [Actinobacteria bacterium 13_1_40CM_2_65_8]OLE78618.1 MAG: hypothetical protein AUG06_09925 [Actinobacteria bacterium 13_1_20CM_2_65_11]